MLCYDFHIHSALSPCGDSDMTPNNIVNMASICGLDAIAVSDHNSIGNVKAVMEAGEKCGVCVLPAMEVETAEEIHVLTLFPDLKAAEYVYDMVYRALPDIKNKPEIFGHQLFMDSMDNVLREEEKLLLSPTSMSLERLFDLVKEVSGLFIPAHIDRHSYSILTNLGFMPENLDIKKIEVSKAVTDMSAYLDSRKDLRKYEVLRNSDAHYLEDIAAVGDVLDFDDVMEIFDKR